MKMYEAAPGHFIPVGQTLETMYQGDAMLDQMIECGFMPDDFVESFDEATETIWITIDGDAIAVTDMSDGHIVNTIRMLRRNYATNHVTYPALVAEAEKRKLEIKEVRNQRGDQMKVYPIDVRAARKSFAAQLTNMIRDFERQTGATVEGINVERARYKYGTLREKFRSYFKGVYIVIEKGSE